jgi:hypothetical protein
MKYFIKNQLSNVGLLPTIDFIRKAPQFLKWIVNGCSGIAPQPIKRIIIKSYLKKYSIKNFIETGTHVGDTLAYIADEKNIACTSIELSDYFFQLNKKRFLSYKNVNLIKGDSGVIINELIPTINNPTLFWLDGHYSGGITGKGALETPISLELESILNSDVEGHIILIDDARCFTGTDDYPYLELLLNQVRKTEKYDIEISADIIRLVYKVTK